MSTTSAIRRFGRSAARLSRTRYPAFLFGGGMPSDQLPVFTYHAVGADALRGDLEFLERNGYRTIGIEEFHDRCTSRGGTGDRCVLLTFDDGLRNFRDEVYPLLREHEARAVAFVPTYWIDGGERLPACDGEHSEAAARARADAAENPGFMTWRELADCAASGVVDVELHSHRHALVASSSTLVGFASPGMLARHDLFDWPMRREQGLDVPGRPPPGTPVYESQPLLSATTRVYEPAEAAEACRELIEAAGGAAAFFGRPGAEAALRKAWAGAVARAGGARPVPPAELEREVDAELACAAGRFERELGHRARYFAYPWMLGTRRSLDKLAELGIEAAFGVGLDFGRARRSRGVPRVYGRFKSDWLRFLPGEGRRRLHQVLPAKAAAFVRSQHLAH